MTEARAALMKDIPIIFSAPMVRALIEGRKTMTRRLAWGKPFSIFDDEDGRQAKRVRDKGCKVSGPDDMGTRIAWPPSPWQKVKTGHRLWVRENFSKYDYRDGCWYWADGREAAYDAERPRPSIHMPRWASRLTLIVTATKIEPLQAISDADAAAEGIVEDDGSEPDIWYVPGAARAGWKIQQASQPSKVFRSLWMELHDADSWDANPNVVALTFRVIKANIDSGPTR